MTRIAILVHSTNPRGGVVHGMQLAEALCDAGHEATLIAPDVRGDGFFRDVRCATLMIPARRETGVAAMVGRRIGEISAFLDMRAEHCFDICHAQDPIGANALAQLVRDRRIAGFARTVHHLDRFEDPRLAAWQERGMRQATRLCVVSRLWRDRLRGDHALNATVVGNGVDVARFTQHPDAHDAALRTRLGLEGAIGPIVLALGGIEPRKNTLGTLEAFLELSETCPDARLVIAGGATLLDHGVYRERFNAALERSGRAGHVVHAGIVADADMPALYRIADLLAFPSLEEGFGLCVLEAMACGCPVVASDIAPFTEYLRADDVIWASPHDRASILAAMRRALVPAVSGRLGRNGPARAARFGWDAVAAAHLPIYAALSETTGETMERHHA